MKKKTFTVFVSGSKHLQEQRVRLKALVNNLNGEFHMKGYPVNFAMYSFMNLGDNQKEYDDFIQHKTDIILFVLVDKMGAKTKEEFLLATKAFRKSGKPKVYVFLKDFTVATPEIAEIEKLVSENSEDYYIDYSNLEELELKVGDRLKHEADKVMEKMNATPVKRMRLFRVWAYLATALALLAGGILLSRAVRHDTTLLFAGGGSAVRCIEQEYENVGNLYDYKNSICIAVPTSTSWPLITSDVINHHAFGRDKGTKSFYPVCLSAMEAKEDDFLKMSSRQQFVSQGSVLSYHIGDDDLVLYVKKSYRNDLIDGKDSICVRDLAQLLNEVSKQRFMVFTTEVGSGTHTYYQKNLAPYGVRLSKAYLGDNVGRFTDLTPKSKIKGDGSPYLMLGSKYYVAREVLDDGDCRGLIVLDDDGNTIFKSNYLYFSGYYYDEGASFWIPTEMVQFLKKLNPDFSKIIKGNRIPRDYERVIVDLNSYLE